MGSALDQENHQIHDVGAGGAGNEKIAERLKEPVGIVVGKTIAKG